MMQVGLIRVRMRIAASGSLKAKRKVVKSLKDRLAARFNIAVAEVDDQDKWQAATLGIAAVGNDAVFVRSVLDKVLDLLHAEAEAEVIDCATDVFAV